MHGPRGLHGPLIFTSTQQTEERVIGDSAEGIYYTGAVAYFCPTI